MKQLQQVVMQICEVVLGKEEQVRLAVACLLAQGHLLIEDLPGMAKTTLAQALAHVFSLQFRRVQFTSDMLPADILGVSVFDPAEQSFRLKPGPVFTQLLLADEINRATPKTQSALLEAMEERQVTLDGETRALPSPFFVVATQNPVTQTGTYALPESQLDRFLMRLSLGYPAAEHERQLLSQGGAKAHGAGIKAVMDGQALVKLMSQVDKVRASEELIDYVQRLLDCSRTCGLYVAGLSPRAGLGLLRSARAWALLAGRGYVIPEDVQAVLGPVSDHRLQAVAGNSVRGAAAQLLEAVPVVR